MDLLTYVRTNPGAATRLAKDLDITPVLITQWVRGVEDRLLFRKKPIGRQVPEDRAPAIEWHTDFQVRVEELCPNTRWQRVKDPAWPLGKPLIDKTPAKAIAALLLSPPATPVSGLVGSPGSV